MAQSHEKLDQALENAGISKTIYALVMPETEAVIDEIIDGGVQREIIENSLRSLFAEKASWGVADIAAITARLAGALSDAREEFRDIYREAWTQKQDRMHEEFFEVWKLWSSPIVQADWSKFPFMYPTAGASEGLRAVINEYGNRARAGKFTPRIHVFKGEYEGFSAYANAAYIEVVEHSRKDWRMVPRRMQTGEQFYISQPSAIDGNVWDKFDDFACMLYEGRPEAELMLDLTYVGDVARDFKVRADYPNIRAVFFSLSKPTGAYYHRIGGCLTKGRLAHDPELPAMQNVVNRDERYSSLFGNKWFKILLALRIGTEMMKRHDVFSLPRKYAALQTQAIEQVNKALALQLEPSDVYLLGTMKPSPRQSDLEGYLKRGEGSNALVRVCLTPTIARLIDPEIDATVRSRPHEGIEIKEGP